MCEEQSEPSDFEQFVIQITRKNRPNTVEQLVKLVRADFKMPEQEILKKIVDLQDQGKIFFRENPQASVIPFINYIRSSESKWYWITMALSMVTIALVFTAPELAFPVLYIRYVLGSVFVLVLPGYTLIKALFPTKELDGAERAALSIGMSLALVAIVGLLLNYTSWGIRTSPITISIFALTVTFATAAIIREYQKNHT